MVKDLAIQILIKKVEELTRRLKKLEKENKILRLENTMLKSQNEVLKAEIAELRVKLESNSHNTNKPPSSDGYKKKTVKPAFPKGKGSSQGGQKGHKGHTLQQVQAPDKISDFLSTIYFSYKYTEVQSHFLPFPSIFRSNPAIHYLSS